MALANSYSRTIGNKIDNKIYCIEEGSLDKVYFWVVSLFKVVERKSRAGQTVKAVEVCVIRCDDFKIGTLVFIEGHRHATFFEKRLINEEEIIV
jgi:hypothetical protein